jgi:hypothetical protein
MPLVLLLTTAGFQVPVIPFVDVFGKVGTASPSQIVELVPNGNAGVIFGLTVTVKVVPVTHPVVEGVNTYVAELLGSTTAGFQVPVIPLSEVLGNTGTVPLPQIVNPVPNEKTGTFLGLTITVRVTGIPQVPAAGVNVYVPVV